MELTNEQKLELWKKSKVRWTKWKEIVESYNYDSYDEYEDLFLDESFPDCPMCPIFKKRGLFSNITCEGCLWQEKYGNCLDDDDDKFTQVVLAEHAEDWEEVKKLVNEILEGIEEEITKLESTI